MHITFRLLHSHSSSSSSSARSVRHMLNIHFVSSSPPVRGLKMMRYQGLGPFPFLSATAICMSPDRRTAAHISMNSIGIAGSRKTTTEFAARAALAEANPCI